MVNTRENNTASFFENQSVYRNACERNPAVLRDYVSYSSPKTNSRKHVTLLRILQVYSIVLDNLPLSQKSVCNPSVFSIHSHFPSLSSPGVCLSFLGLSFFFSHALRKLRLFLLSSVDSPLTVIKQHGGISVDSKLHSRHYASSIEELKRKWRADAPLK